MNGTTQRTTTKRDVAALVGCRVTITYVTTTGAVTIAGTITGCHDQRDVEAQRRHGRNVIVATGRNTFRHIGERDITALQIKRGK